MLIILLLSLEGNQTRNKEWIRRVQKKTRTVNISFGEKEKEQQRQDKELQMGLGFGRCCSSKSTR
jgi:uncharacterized protein (UPF0303 family)